ncbi:MAG: fatty acyl-AMP ligase [Deltaproteobacteria bacterium]|nr:MAG: fatty acyl-AMP ligase [Deltaproteobacteria bacterium]
MSRFPTLAHAVAEIGEQYPELGYTFQDTKGEETFYTFPQMAEQTARRAAALQALGLKKGDRAGLIIVEPEDFVLTFFAMFRLGVVPVPLYPPLSLGNLDAYAARTAHVLTSADAKVLVASASLQNILWSQVDKVPSLSKLVKAEDLAKGGANPDLPQITPDDIAFLQYTSGSTSDPKGVMVTHRCLVANCEGIIEHGLQLHPDRGDKGISWLPLYHDMGLIGFVISPILYGIPVVFIPTLRFIKRPTCWLETIHKHRGTASFAPNFAYALVARKAKPADLERWDLSCVKAFGCGAEPIHPETMRQFNKIFGEHCDLSPTALLPAYGMAEATLAISLKPVESVMVTRQVNAEEFQENGVVLDPDPGQPIEEHVACGVAFPGHEIGIFADDGERLPDGLQGEIAVRGPSVTPGYFRNPDATQKTFRDGWLFTGDLGYTLDGQVYVTGRVKDLIILNGRNIHPQAVEWAASNVDGVRKGNVVAFSRPGEHSEELVIALETRETDTDRLIADVRKAVQREMSLSLAEVICLAPGTLPKTSSGKLQRAKTRSQYLRGTVGREGVRTAGATGDRVTLARHVAASVWSRAKAALRG